jgi:hypothetical protein
MAKKKIMLVSGFDNCNNQCTNSIIKSIIFGVVFITWNLKSTIYFLALLLPVL